MSSIPWYNLLAKEKIIRNNTTQTTLFFLEKGADIKRFQRLNNALYSSMKTLAIRSK